MVVQVRLLPLALYARVAQWLRRSRMFTYGDQALESSIKLRLFSKVKHSLVSLNRTLLKINSRCGFDSRGALYLWASSLMIERELLCLIGSLNVVGDFHTPANIDPGAWVQALGSPALEVHWPHAVE